MSATDDELALLEADAHYYAPRRFALYGVYPEKKWPPFLGWGLEFPLPRKAILWIANGPTWQSESATKLLARYQSIAEARMVWLDDDGDGPHAEDYDLAAG